MTRIQAWNSMRKTYLLRAANKYRGPRDFGMCDNVSSLIKDDKITLLTCKRMRRDLCQFKPIGSGRTASWPEYTGGCFWWKLDAEGHAKRADWISRMLRATQEKRIRVTCNFPT